MLKTTFSDLSRSVYDNLQDRDDPKKMTWNGVSDTIRRFVFGIYDRDKIPVYIVHAVQEIEDTKWNAFFTQRAARIWIPIWNEWAPVTGAG